MVTINVEMKNDFGEVESRTTVMARSYAAAARKARAWLRGAGVENPTHIFLDCCSEERRKSALWVYESKPEKR